MIGKTNDAINQVLMEAGNTRNMQAAINKYGGSLSPQEKTRLLSLTQADLAALSSINKKLSPLGVTAMAR